MQSLAVAILVKSYSAQNFQRPPTHPALYRQRVHLTWGAIGSASAQQLHKKRSTSFHPGGRVGFHCKDCAWSYDMVGHAKKCVERYCELANKTTQQLYKVSTPCIDDHHFKEEETKSVGELSSTCS